MIIKDDADYQVYKCPHCEGFMVTRAIYPPFTDGACISLEHYTELPDWLKGEEPRSVPVYKVGVLLPSLS